MLATNPLDPRSIEVAMAESPPDHATQILLNRLVVARIEAKWFSRTMTVSLIGTAILNIDPAWTGDDPIAQNDNGSSPDEV